MPTIKAHPRTAEQLSHQFIVRLFRGDDWTSLYQLIQTGLDKKAFRAGTVTEFLEHAISESAARSALRPYLVTERSWKRRVSEKSPLSASELDRLTDVGEVIREARRIWGDNDAAERFLTRPHARLRGKRPVEVAATEGGAQAVRELMSRIQEGAPA